MTCPTVVGGVDTHKHTHHATVIGADGVLIASQEFPATSAGHSQLAVWFIAHGEVRAVGVEGTGSFGAPVARSLQAQGITVVEVNRPNREARRRSGKSDVLDAEQAARAVLACTATAAPKSKAGSVEVIRMLRITRSTAVKSRTQAMNAIHSVIVSAPDPLRDQLIGLSKRTLIRHCQRLELHANLVEIARTSTGHGRNNHSITPTGGPLGAPRRRDQTARSSAPPARHRDRSGALRPPWCRT